MKMKRGPGRPAFAKGTAKTGVFSVKVSDDERAVVSLAAEKAGKPVSKWARETLLMASFTTTHPNLLFGWVRDAKDRSDEVFQSFLASTVRAVLERA